MAEQEFCKLQVVGSNPTGGTILKWDMAIELKKLKSRLETERRELAQLFEASQESRRPVQLDQTAVGRLSRMDALQSQAMAVETGRRREVELHRKEAALQRIEDGEYGDCVNCGKEIGQKRLELDPAIPTCIDCAEK